MLSGSAPACGPIAGQRRLAEIERGHTPAASASDVSDGVRAGDFLEVHALGVGVPPRTGQVLEVLGGAGHRRYRVRWDEEHETIFYPAGGVTLRRHSPTAPDRAWPRPSSKPAG